MKFLGKDIDKKLFIPYIPAGYPDISFTKELILLYDRMGVDGIEIGIPFSDPIADGEVIQYASQIALKNKITLHRVLEVCVGLKSKINTPLIVMSYYNPILQYGEDLIPDLKRADIRCMVIPDLPFDDKMGFYKKLESNDIYYSHLVANNTPKNRMISIVKSATGFVYYTSYVGITGKSDSVVSDEIKKRVMQIKRHTDLPVIVGFGISKKKQAQEITKAADGIIIASAIIKIIINNEKQKRQKILKKIASFIEEFVNL